MTTTTIRRIHAANLDDLHKLDQTWHRSDFAHYLPGESRNVNGLVAFEYGRPVGHLCYEFSADSFHVARLYVAPMARKRGHGRALIGEMRSWLRDGRQTRIVVHCGEEAGDMQRFLHRMGFVCRRCDQWGLWFVCGLVPEQWRPHNRIAQYVEDC